MGKMSELSMLIDEYREATRHANELANDLIVAITGSKSGVQKPKTLEEVRAILSEISLNGFTAQIRELLSRYGADRLSAIGPTNYNALLTDVAEYVKEEIAHAT